MRHGQGRKPPNAFEIRQVARNERVGRRDRRVDEDALRFKVAHQRADGGGKVPVIPCVRWGVREKSGRGEVLGCSYAAAAELGVESPCRPDAEANQTIGVPLPAQPSYEPG